MGNRCQYNLLRRCRNAFYTILTLLFLALLVFVGTISPPAHAANRDDLLSNIPAVDENALNNAACGVAAATMILDYYLPQSGPIGQAIDISAVAQYVQENYWYDAKTNKKIFVGTNTEQLQTGIEAASIAPALHFGNPLTASWHTTDSTGWFSILKSELDARRPIIAYLADGGALGWPWHYGHYIVVSGYSSDQSIIYHDPWNGKAHTLSNAAFAAAWGTTWAGNPPWWYMQVIPSIAPITSASPTVVPSLALSPTLAPVQPLLSVIPSRLFANTDCSWSSEGLHGGDWTCTLTLKSNPGIQQAIQWSASANWTLDPNLPVSFNPPRGSLAPGSSTQVTVIVSSYNRISCPSPNFTGILSFAGTANTVMVPWSCNPPSLSVSPTSLTEKTNCTRNPDTTWNCNVTVAQHGIGLLYFGVSASSAAIVFDLDYGELGGDGTSDVYTFYIAANTPCPTGAQLTFTGPGNAVTIAWSC